MAETKMQLADWLDDLCVRFILNLPQEELTSVERICFQVEEAQWFYEDFVRPIDSSLPSMNLRQFCLLLFQVCPLLCNFSHEQHMSAYSQFLAYKTRVPVRGVILLNEAMDQVVLVKGYKKGANWSFPRGKINKDEKDLDCAVREAYEETGFNLEDAGLVPDDANVKYIEVTMREQHMKLFVFRDVPQDTDFQPRTRKEISKISWWNLATLPGWRKKKPGIEQHEAVSANKLYMVAPFLPTLKKWIAQQRRADAQTSLEPIGNAYLSAADGQFTDGDVLGEDEISPDAHRYTAVQGALQGSSHTGLPQAPSMDAAAQMKALLGVQQSSFTTGEPLHEVAVHSRRPELDQNSGNLLSLLRGSAVHDPGSTQQPPQTPFGQVQFHPEEPRSPTHHHQQQLANQSTIAETGPPPQFPNLGSSQPTHRLQKSSFGGYGPNGMYSSHQAFNAAAGLGYRQEDAEQPHPAQVPNLAAQLSRQDAAPYQRTGDPMFARPQGNEGPVAPAASQLPTPKLSSHAQSLLSMFSKSSEKAMPPQRSTATPARQTILQPPIGTPPQTTRPDATPRSSSLQAFGGLIPSNVMNRRDSTNVAKQAEKPRPTDQQNTLLGLFKGDSAPAATSQSARKPPSTTQPAELAAYRSPPQASDAIFQSMGPPSKDRVVPKILQRPGSAHRQAPVEVPAVTTPKNVPQEVEGSAGRKKSSRQDRTPKKTTKAKSPAFTPTQILKRPSEPAKETTGESPLANSPKSKVSPMPANAVLLPGPPAELEGAKEKPFQPQILRRPQSVSRPTSSTSKASPLQAQPSNDDRKQSLLNLFTAPRHPSISDRTASPAPSNTGPNTVSRIASPNKQDLSRSMINSISTNFADASSSHMSRSGSMQSGVISPPSGVMSPSELSAADRGSLMNYLEGVLKGQRK